MGDNFAKEFQHEMVFIHGLYGQNGQYRGLIKALEKRCTPPYPFLARLFCRTIICSVLGIRGVRGSQEGRRSGL